MFQGQGGTGGLSVLVLQMVAIGLVFYFLILRPSSQARKKHAELLSNLKKGDEVMTSGASSGRCATSARWGRTEPRRPGSRWKAGPPASSSSARASCGSAARERRRRRGRRRHEPVVPAPAGLASAAPAER